MFLTVLIAEIRHKQDQRKETIIPSGRTQKKAVTNQRLSQEIRTRSNKVDS